MKSCFLFLVVLALSACAAFQQPTYPDDSTGVQWRKNIGAYRGN